MIRPKLNRFLPNAKCQKCLQQGHWTADCTNERIYKSRPSRTALLGNPSLKTPEQILHEQDIRNAAIQDEERARLLSKINIPSSPSSSSFDSDQTSIANSDTHSIHSSNNHDDDHDSDSNSFIHNQINSHDKRIKDKNHALPPHHNHHYSPQSNLHSPPRERMAKENSIPFKSYNHNHDSDWSSSDDEKNSQENNKKDYINDTTPKRRKLLDSHDTTPKRNKN